MRISGEISRVAAPSNAVSAEAEQLRAPFEAQTAMTVGLEEELMLLDPETFDLVPHAPELLARVHGDARFKEEMPAAQLEIAVAPAATVADGAAALREARHLLAAAAEGLALVAGAGVHPFAAAEGVLNGGDRYDRIADEFGTIARRQLVYGLHVHVAVPGADRALAVYNAVRAEVPAIAALGAASPYYEGADSGLASVRPKLCDLLPRQGVPPGIPSWEALAEAFAWGRRSGHFADPGQWWWEARLHPLHGTVEVRAPDAQATVGDTAAIAAVVHALVATLAARHDAGEVLGMAPSWKIGENRWSACRHGVEGPWSDPESGQTIPMREHLRALIDDLAPAARELGCADELEAARDLVARPRAAQAREIGRDAGAPGLASYLTERFAG